MYEKFLSIHDAKYIAKYKYLMNISDRISLHEVYVNAVASYRDWMIEILNVD